MFLFESNTHGQLGSIIGVIEFAKSISFCNNLAPLWFSRGLIAPITDKSWTKIRILGLRIFKLGRKNGQFDVKRVYFNTNEISWEHSHAIYPVYSNVTAIRKNYVIENSFFEILLQPTT